MRLGFVCNPYHRGGITHWMVDMAVAWCRSGNSAWFVTPRPKAPFVNGAGRPTMGDLLEPFAAIPKLQVETPLVGAGFEFGTESYRASIYIDAVRRGIPCGTPLIVSDDPAAWRAAAAITREYPFIGVLHSDGDACYTLAARYGRSVAALVGVSQRITKRARSILGVPAIPIATISCGTVLSALRRTEAQEHDGKLRLVWVGRMDEETKRVSDLPKIAARLRAMGVAYTLDVIGSGPDAPAVERAVSALALADCVRLRGWMRPTEIGTILDQTDVLLLPSNYEGMPMVVMEALAHGCAVVASRVSGIEDYEATPLSRDCLWVHAVGDIDDAATKVALANQVSRPARVLAARRLAEAEFAIGVCVRRYTELLSRIDPAVIRQPARFLPSRLTRLMSLPVAAQRLARVWYGHRRPMGRSQAAHS